MDAETIKFITDMNREQSEYLKDIITANGTVIRGKIESEIDRIDEMDKLRNGRITKVEEDIDSVCCETKTVRWLWRNPKTGYILIVILIAAISLGAYQINLKRTIEKVLHIELKAE